ncbi:hypothetical protein [Variovorax sp. JS1663]|uniref:hypothetical protein n=1 Tax=Variovorax sp. JS1663 TaxID=1851577 RepID=UPI000B34252A|nr:hypothetical protein [Variovorax sp. JS1663]OUL98343.1 hypothetical protein A8M77_32105 [Variovorax sp. JS1663]
MTLVLGRSHVDVDGKAVKWSPGMKLTAEIKMGRRIMAYLLSPVQRAASGSVEGDSFRCRTCSLPHSAFAN